MSSLCSPARAAACSPQSTFSAGPAKAMSKTTHTVRKSSAKESPTVFWTPLPSSETSTPSSERVTPKHVREWLMLSPPDFLASPSASPDEEPEPTIIGTNGRTHSESFAQWDRDSSSWKTFPGLRLRKGSFAWLLKNYGNLVFLTRKVKSRARGESFVSSSRLSDQVTSDAYSGTWPKRGMMRNGVCWERMTLAPRIGARDSGFWPTPVGNEGRNRRLPDGKRGWGLESLVRGGTATRRTWPTPRAVMPSTMHQSASGGPPQNLRIIVENEERRTWPTPRADERQQHNSQDAGQALSRAVKWPTPRANKIEGYSRDDFRPTLAQMATKQDKPQHGQLNPFWVEWLMGVPIGWTALEPLAMPKFRSWLRQHGISSETR